MILCGFLVLAFLPLTALSYPFGAGACLTGRASTEAPGSPHAAGTPTKGSLADDGLLIEINGNTHAAGDTIDLETGTTHTITLSGSAFKGFLLRVGVSPGVLTTIGAVSQIASACTAQGVSGVTHLTNENKTSVSASLLFTTAKAKVPLDVTVVVQLYPTSKYYYSNFTLNAVTSGTLPPTRMPSSAPSKHPTKVLPPTPPPTKKNNCRGPLRCLLCRLVGVLCK